MGRYLIDQETSLETIEEILADRTWERDVERIVHVDLDYVYDEDEVQQGRIWMSCSIASRSRA
ncbi:hypothetical protein [Modicisalibacter luteus]|uniref:hypothetical protein n=1 Tax=Modicisalibacter luteus TaxID=453962 RepID=UPI003627A032